MRLSDTARPVPGSGAGEAPSRWRRPLGWQAAGASFALERGIRCHGTDAGLPGPGGVGAPRPCRGGDPRVAVRADPSRDPENLRRRVARGSPGSPPPECRELEAKAGSASRVDGATSLMDPMPEAALDSLLASLLPAVLPDGNARATTRHQQGLETGHSIWTPQHGRPPDGRDITNAVRLIIRRSLVRVQPAPPFALVKSHILDLGAFQFDITRSLLPAVLPIVHARQSFFRPPRACVASYRGTLGLRVHRWAHLW
jgi:hypothetical protein